MPAPEVKTDRNAGVLNALQNGDQPAAVARHFGISRQRVHQIKMTAAKRAAKEGNDGNEPA